MTLEDNASAHPNEGFPAELRQAQIEGLSIRYARAPLAGAETLLLLSPWPESLFAFLPIWSRLAERYDLLALDLPGFGGSEGRPDVIAPEAMGHFIAAAARHFGLEKPHAIGPDIGTSSLLFAAANHPDLFASITIGSGGAAFPLDVTNTLKDLIAAPSLDALMDIPVEGFIDSVLKSLRNYSAPDFVREDYIVSYSGPGRIAESARLVRRYPDELPLLKDRLAGIRTPVLVVMGRYDPYVPVSNGQYLAERLPVARLEVVDTGHLVWEDAAEIYGGLVLDWVGTHKRP